MCSYTRCAIFLLNQFRVTFGYWILDNHNRLILGTVWIYARIVLQTLGVRQWTGMHSIPYLITAETLLHTALPNQIWPNKHVNHRVQLHFCRRLISISVLQHLICFKISDNSDNFPSLLRSITNLSGNVLLNAMQFNPVNT